MRLFDIIFSVAGLLILFPFLMIISICILLTSKGPAIFIQKRVGQYNKDFDLYKFRTMVFGAQQNGSLTLSNKDRRITRVGFFLRKYKLDELPQLFNVLKNDMSIVGPRPELRKYVELYNETQRQILSAKPGITDYASIKYRNESRLLMNAQDPEAYYVNEIMPTKISLNKKYISAKSSKQYFFIIYKTLISVTRN